MQILNVKFKSVKYLHLLLVLILSHTVHAIAGDEIRGIVKDKSTNQVLPYATIALADGTYGVISDASGSFRLEIDNAGDRDTLVISYVGYQTIRLTAQDILDKKTILLTPYVFPIEGSSDHALQSGTDPA